MEAKSNDLHLLLYPENGKIQWQMIDEAKALHRRLGKLAADGIAPFCVNVSAAWRGFCATVEKQPGDSFSVADIAAVCGTNVGMVRQWTAMGVLPSPDRSRRGKGYPRRWSYQSAFVAGLVATMHRHGVPWAALREFGTAFSAATQRKRLKRIAALAAN